MLYSYVYKKHNYPTFIKFKHEIVSTFISRQCVNRKHYPAFSFRGVIKVEILGSAPFAGTSTRK